MTVKIRALVVLLFIAAGATGCGKSSSHQDVKNAFTPTTNVASPDVVVNRCGLTDNQSEGPQADLIITNHSSSTANYSITVAFRNPDGSAQFDTADATVTALSPGQTTHAAATSAKASLHQVPDNFTCQVMGLTRTP